MAKPKAFLRHVNKRTIEQPISIKLSSGKISFQVALGISIDPNGFDVKAGLLRASHADSLRINERIRIECQYFEKAEKQLRANGLDFTVHHMASAYSRIKGLQEQSDEYLRNVRHINYNPNSGELDEMKANLADLMLQVELQRRKIEEREVECGLFESVLLTHYFAKFIALHANSFSKGTQRIYQNACANVKQFNADWRISEVTEDNLAAFQSFLFAKSLKNVTVNMIMSKLKYVMNHFAPRLGVISGYNTFRVPKKEKPANNTYFLTVEELAYFRQLPPKHNRERYVRDTFVVQCLTGLRISDVRFNRASVKKDHDGEFYINVITVKTNQSVTIPLFEVVREILERYDYQLPHIDTSEFNRLLKGMCARMELDSMQEEVTYTNTSGSKKIVLQQPKWKMISSHCGRKTFVNLNSIAGVHPRILAGMTGHKDLNVLLNSYMSKTANRREEIRELKKLVSFNETKVVGGD